MTRSALSFHQTLAVLQGSVTSFVAQFGTCASFTVHLRLQSDYTDKLYAQGKLLSPAEQSHVNSV